MRLYDINTAMENLVDQETGEILDIAAFDELALAKEEKLESVALWYKNLVSDAEQLKAEEQNLSQRRKTAENKAARLKEYLSFWLGGERFETPKVKCSWRKSEAIEVLNDTTFISWAETFGHKDLLSYKDPTPNKTAIKEYIKNGGDDVTGAELVSKNSLSVK